MSNDFSSSHVKDINWDIHLPTTLEGTDIKNYELFHCPICGIHPKVICETRAIRYEELTQVRLINIYPDSIIVNFVLGDSIPGDVEIYNYLICGKCGSPGHICKIPEFVLIAHGILPIKYKNRDKRIEE